MVRPANPNQGTESFQYPPPGPSSVLEYQASGLPYVTQSSHVGDGLTASRVEFPFVTKFFTIKNNGPGDLSIGFTLNGVLGTNVFTLPESGSFSGDIRVTDLYMAAVSGSTTEYEIIAGLTQIPRKNYFILTGALNGFSGSQELYGDRGFGYPGLG
jgi:hypothetical protein